MTDRSSSQPDNNGTPAKKPDTLDRELVVHATKGGMEIALLEDGRLVEYHVAQEDSRFNVGDIYLGTVRKINPGLNAAFVDVGHEKDAFLHYTDLGPRFRSLFQFTQRAIKGSLRSHLPADSNLEQEIVKTGKMGQVINRGQQVLVQVLKEPISSKGPRITAEVALPGRYIVMTPFNGAIGVSRRITSAAERKRLQRLLESIVPKHWGVIARTAAEGKEVADLHEDVQQIMAQWENTVRNLHQARAPQLVFSETRKINALTRDLLSKTFRRITTDDFVLATELREYLQQLNPGAEKMVHHFASKKPLFDAIGITKQIKGSFGETVSLRSGAYLVIQHTEALHVIDINSGPKIARRADQEENALAVNLETAQEVARQLRLRDLGGIIIVDFIDMKSAESKRQVYEAMKEAMKEDRAKHSILPLSKFGLMQITRQRVRPEVNIVTQEKCPSCKGTGKVESTLLLIDEIENRLEYILSLRGHKQVHLHTHPFIEAYLKKGLWNSRQVGWYRRWRKWIRVHAQAGFTFTEYRFTNASNEEIRLDE